MIFVEPACGGQDIVVAISVQCMCIRCACVCVHPSGFVQAISSIFMHGFQKKLAQLFSLSSRSAI